MQHIFIINPHAGKKDQTGRIYEMADRLRQHGLTCQCLLTQRSGGAEEIARRLVSSGEEVRLYACGGDGTLNEVVNGAAGFDNAAVTCIPIGTGNDFLKNFGPDAAKFTDAENLWDGEVHPLDLIDCNGRQCLTIACSGIDARVAESVHELGDSPFLSGRGSYLAAVAVNFLFRGIGQHWRVTLDDEVIEDDFALVSMCNGRYYGGGSGGPDGRRHFTCRTGQKYQPPEICWIVRCLFRWPLPLAAAGGDPGGDCQKRPHSVGR